MNERILCVDDEPCVLQAYQCALRKNFIIDSALNGEEAFKKIARHGPYAVVVADNAGSDISIKIFQRHDGETFTEHGLSQVFSQ